MDTTKTTLAVAAIVLVAAGLFALQPSSLGNLTLGKSPETVPYVDIPSYLGVWYEQSVIPYFWEKGCSKTTATYSMNKDGSLRVDNKCMRSGSWKESVGKAIPEDSTNSKLSVQVGQRLDIKGQYWIVRLAKDYSYTVVSSPDYKLLWVMSRVPVMDETLYRSILADLQKDGFAVDKLVRTQQ